MKYARIDAVTKELLYTQEFLDDELPPVDIPHKGILWRKVEEFYPKYDAEFEGVEFDTYEVTDTAYIKKYKVVPLPEVPEDVSSPKTLREIQSNFFTSDKVSLTMFVYDLFNEVRLLKGEEPVNLDTFKEILRNYA